MVDKVDVRIPWHTRPSEQLKNTLAELQHGPMAPFRPSRHYAYMGDLREIFNIDAVLHLQFRRAPDDKPTSKLEIIDAGKKTVLEMAETITRVFDIDPFDCELMRLDLASDIVGVPVHVLRDSSRFRYKRFATRIEKSSETEMEFRAMGTADSQTFNAGRRPNFIRIYNKVKELYGQWLKLSNRCRRFNKGMAEFEMSFEERYYGVRVCPTFEEFCLKEGFEYLEGMTITRIERQIGGGKFPIELQSFDDLRRVNRFDPFSSMKILRSTAIRSFDEPPKGVSVRDWLAALGLDRLQRDFGNAHQAFSFVQRHGNGNGKRVLESLMEIMPAERPPITEAEILDSFVRSTERQLVGLEGS